MRKYLLLSLMALLPMTALITVTSCGGGDEVVQPPVDNNANNDKDNPSGNDKDGSSGNDKDGSSGNDKDNPSGNDKDNPSGNNGENLDIHVIVNDDGTTSNGSIFSAIDNQNFYVDYIKYTVTEGYLTVSGYDKTGFKGIAKIISKLTYKGNTYEVLEIGYMVFYNCTSLTSITIPNSVTRIGQEAFYKCSSLTSITIPNSVTSIGYEAFYGCTYLTSITIGSGVTSIGSGTFYDCRSLTSITIPSSVTSIGSIAFRGCSSLTSITIGSGVTSIDEYAFYECSSLTDVYCYAENVPSTGSNVFYESPISSATLHVPARSVNSYKSQSPWSRFGRIVAIE